MRKTPITAEPHVATAAPPRRFQALKARLHEGGFWREEVRARRSGQRRGAIASARAHRSSSLGTFRLMGIAGISFLLAASGLTVASAASAATSPLGTAAPFAILAGSEITDVPTSSITGDVGLSPAAGSNITGLTKAEVTGTIYSVNASGPGGSVDDPGLLTTAKHDLTTAFVTTAATSPTVTFTSLDNQLGGKTLKPGVYAFGHASTANITAPRPLVLNGDGNLNSVFIFQASSDLVTATSSVVRLENDAQACHVLWVVGSSATLGSGSTFVGTLMALTSATLDSTATVQGRILARNGAVTLDANTITIPATCKAAVTPTPPKKPPKKPTKPPVKKPTKKAPTAVSPTKPKTSTGTVVSTTQSAKIPHGSPATGEGGAAHVGSPLLVDLGAATVLSALALAGFGIRRRKLVTRTLAHLAANRETVT